jgi:hypothetical protein
MLPPVPEGAVQVPSSRKYRLDPAVAPGSGTAPITWLAPLGPNTGSRTAAIVPLVIDPAARLPFSVVAFSVVTLITGAVKVLGDIV